ncbi:hypothetical protein E8E11_008421 [Didymella keratinophila]|nr:hypothetical protein E8E11_008421 [Didymella keratinophila]
MAIRVASAVPHDVSDSRPEGNQPLETPTVPAPPVPKYPPVSRNPSNGSASNPQSDLPGTVLLGVPSSTQPTAPSASTPRAAAQKSTLGCPTVDVYMRVPPSLSGSGEATYELLAGFLRTFQDKIIIGLRNDYIQYQQFHKGCNLLFMDTNKHFIADDCASSVLKKQGHR